MAASVARVWPDFDDSLSFLSLSETMFLTEVKFCVMLKTAEAHDETYVGLETSEHGDTVAELDL